MYASWKQRPNSPSIVKAWTWLGTQEDISSGLEKIEAKVGLRGCGWDWAEALARETKVDEGRCGSGAVTGAAITRGRGGLHLFLFLLKVSPLCCGVFLPPLYRICPLLLRWTSFYPSLFTLHAFFSIFLFICCSVTVVVWCISFSRVNNPYSCQYVICFADFGSINICHHHVCNSI